MRSIWESLSWVFEADEDDKPKHSKEDEPKAGGKTQIKGAPDAEDEPLPKADQPAPGTAAGIGAGRIAAKQAEPTSVSLGARARKIDPGVSGIKQKFGVSPDAFFGDAPVKVDPKTGKMHNLRGRPRKDAPENPELVHEPFAAQHAKAMAAATTPQEKPKATSYDVGPWQQAAAHLPKGGEVRQTGKDPNVGRSKAANSKLTAASDAPRKGDFHGQRWAPAGHTAADEEEWADDPALSARRIGGNTGKKMRYDMPAVGQAGRMKMPARAGSGAEVVWNQHAGQWQDPEQFAQSQQDFRAKMAAKLAMRGAAQANVGNRPWAAANKAPGAVVPKDAATQKADARAAAVASKPLPVNTRRDPQAPQAQAAGSPPEAPQAPQTPPGIDREKLKALIAQRLAQRVAKK